MNILENISLKKYTTLGIGGSARYFVEVQSTEELEEAVSWAKEKSVNYLVIAGGSNLLISDDGFDGLVIKLTASGISEIDGKITVKAGTPLQELVDFTIEHGLDGMSTMTGIPGTVGGAVYGSAGAYGDNIRDFIKEITYFNGETVKTITKGDYDTGYRDSIFKRNKNWIIMEVTFAGMSKADSERLRKEAAEVLEKRSKKYNPNYKTPGSFFKNIPERDLTPGQLATIRKAISKFEKTPSYVARFGNKPVVMFGKIPAGNPIDMLGGNGDQMGQIKIDDYHGNTFLNLGDGKAVDFFKLAKKWKDKVWEAYGIELEPEVQFVGFKEKF